MAELEHWRMWRARCALDLCEPDARHDLTGFAFNRYSGYLRRIGGAGACVPSASDAWHWFESYLALGRKRSGKACKEWLFSRAAGDATLDVIQGGATLVMRDVVRDQLRRESSPEWMQSLDDSGWYGSGDGYSDISLADLIPGGIDPLEEVLRREALEFARSGSAVVFQGLERRERIAMTCVAAGISLAHPLAVAAGGCSKSSLFTARDSGLRKIAGMVTERYSGQTSSERAVMALMLFESVDERVHEWLENEFHELFLFIRGGGRYGDGNGS